MERTCRSSAIVAQSFVNHDALHIGRPTVCVPITRQDVSKMRQIKSFTAGSDLSTDSVAQAFIVIVDVNAQTGLDPIHHSIPITVLSKRDATN